MIVTRTEPINKTKYAVSIDGEGAVAKVDK